MADTVDLPYRAEYAKSGRASCKKCKGLISKDELRLAIMVQSPMFDGKVPNWHHFMCFFGRARPTTTADIAHFDSLRWEDQKRIKEKISGDADGGGPSKEAGKAKGKKGKKAAQSAGLQDFSTEYAKSNRSTCRGCEEKIAKEEVRISKLDFEGENSKMYGPQPHWFHVDCFVKNREELEFFDSADKLPGYRTLGVDDQKMLKEKLKAIKGKRKQDMPDGVVAKKAKTEDEKEEKVLQAQNKRIFKFRDLLQANLNKRQMQELLEHNEQEVPSGESKLLDRLSDGMAFGALKPCKECKGGQLVYRSDGYHCTGSLTAWTKCEFVTKTPEREPFTIPEELLEVHPSFKSYKYVKKERVFPANPEQPSEVVAAEAANSKQASDSSLPLGNATVVIVGRFKTSHDELSKKVKELGGTLASKIDGSVTCIISTEAEVKKRSKKIQDAEKADIHVVSEDFLEAVSSVGFTAAIEQNNICTWGSDVEKRIKPFQKSYKSIKASKEENLYTKSVPAKLKMTLKGAAAVDPDSGLEDRAHVLEQKGDIYNAVLGLVDIKKGTNSYYKLQVLESDSGFSWWVFRAWGRVGTTIGGNKTDDFPTKLDAIMEFKRLYEEKTGNLWEDRQNFEKHPNRFYPLDIDYGQDNDQAIATLKPGSNSQLAKAIQELICLIFDVQTMKNAMMEFEIDLKKMPLGKLSKKQIESAFSVLSEAQELVTHEGSATRILDASNRFYTLIPHDFGLKKPPLLDNEELIKEKLDMLDMLLEIEVAYSLLKGGDKAGTKDPIDVHYEQLKTNLEVLDKESEEYTQLQQYVKNTHAETHNQYSLNIEEIFKVNRHGEDKRFKPFKKLHNRKLLWHGSRITNFAGILSHGLRIAPPEAPVTGYMFGKGIYFADMVSKSANYCYTSKNNPYGLLLLCDVALGDMYERHDADYITKLPAGKHSTKGLGRTAPDNSQKVMTPEGLEIPLGKGVPSDVTRSSLLYNEYIIYDVAQANIKYLLKLKFNYKY